jgi:hypothetical protein
MWSYILHLLGCRSLRGDISNVHDALITNYFCFHIVLVMCCEIHIFASCLPCLSKIYIDEDTVGFRYKLIGSNQSYVIVFKFVCFYIDSHMLPTNNLIICVSMLPKDHSYVSMIFKFYFMKAYHAPMFTAYVSVNRQSPSWTLDVYRRLCCRYRAW